MAGNAVVEKTEPGARFDPEEAAVAVLAATIQAVRERRARRAKESLIARAASPWVLAGRLAATSNLPR